MDIDKICQNCSFFFLDRGDIDLGVCILDEAFEPFIDQILENDDFSSCYKLYLQKRFAGEKEACDKFEEPEIIDIPEGEDINAYITIENLKHQNVDEITKYLHSSDPDLVKKAISAISTYVYIGNMDAYEGLISYYESLGPAEALDDVNLRLEMIDMLNRYESEQRTIEAYINELARTPSNNTTRKLYTLILKRLSLCPAEIVSGMLIELLDKQQYGYKIRKRILEVAGL